MFLPGKLFLTFLIFCGKPEAYLTERQIDSVSTRKYQTRLERLAREKRSSLFGLVGSDEEKKF